MPELPEVETIARFLNEATLGWTLQRAHFYRQDLREPIPTLAFRRLLEGQALTRVFRRSKYLLMETKGAFGLFHLGMTGKLLLLPAAKPQAPHTHLIINLCHPSLAPRYLHYVDPRRFGRISVQPGLSWQEHPFFVGLGREPLGGKGLGDYLFAQSRGRRVPVKPFLMDAKVVVGVGNIYACEALFRAGIHPERPAASLTLADYTRLARSVRTTLRQAITAGGTSFRDYRNAQGEKGYFAVALQVYGRKEAACLVCGNLIVMLRQAGRSTWCCGNCQT